jgi:hypothetical protein
MTSVPSPMTASRSLAAWRVEQEIGQRVAGLYGL